MLRPLSRPVSAALALVTLLASAVVALALGPPPAAAGYAAPQSAAAASPFGVQRLLVILVEHPITSCGVVDITVAQCPRYTAAQWQVILRRDLNAWYAAETYGQVSFDVHVLANPAQPNGWWPAPHTRAQYGERDAFYQQGSLGRDAGEVILGEAMRLGYLSPSELDATHRLVVMDNYHGRGGTTNGISNPLTYHPNGRPFLTTVSLIPEATNDAEALSLAEHELGHQLGAPDLYEYPCTLFIPGDVRDLRTNTDNDCVGPWDHMADDWRGFPGFGAYTKQRVGWLNAQYNAVTVREVTTAFVGTVALDPVERPGGGPLVLRVPTNPNAATIGAITGDPGPYEGYLVECRRRIGNDKNLPAEGLLVSYVDPERSAYAPLAVARQPFGAVADSALSTIGTSYSNSTAHVKFTYAGPTANGGCFVDVNRTRYVFPHYVPDAMVNSQVAAAAPVYGTTASFSGFAGAGVSVTGGSASTRADLRAAPGDRTKVRATRKGKRATISFSYSNAGGKVAKGGTAVVRVNDPYTVSVCGPAPKGRVVARVKLKTLKPGTGATQRVSFVPRTNGPLGVSVQIARSGKDPAQAGGQEAANFSFTTATSDNDEVQASRTEFRISSSKKCDGPVTPHVTPLVLPTGWTIRAKGADALLAPGKSRKVTVIATPPKGTTPRALQVPIAITTGEVRDHPEPEVQYGYATGPLKFLGGLDLLLRVGKPGKPKPPYVLVGPPDLPNPVSYPETPPPPSASTLTLTCPPAEDFTPTVGGVLAPAQAGVMVTLTYTHVADGATLAHEVSTGIDGGFSDDFSDARTNWTVEASWGGDAAHDGATSNSCHFGFITGRFFD